MSLLNKRINLICPRMMIEQSSRKQSDYRVFMLRGPPIQFVGVALNFVTTLNIIE